MTRLIVYRWLFVGVAVALFGVGMNSGRTPLFDPSVWLLLCSIAAGAALSVAAFYTVTALRGFAFTATLVAAARSYAYLDVEAWSPLFVWLGYVALLGIVYLHTRPEMLTAERSTQ